MNFFLLFFILIPNIDGFVMWIEGLDKKRLQTTSLDNSKTPALENIEYTFYPNEEIQLRCHSSTGSRIQMYFNNNPNDVVENGQIMRFSLANERLIVNCDMQSVYKNTVIQSIQITFLSISHISIEKLDWKRLDFINELDLYYSFYYNERIDLKCMKSRSHIYKEYYVELKRFVHGENAISTKQPYYNYDSVILTGKFNGAEYTCSLKHWQTSQVHSKIKLHLIYLFNMRIEGLAEERIRQRSLYRLEPFVVTYINYIFYPNEEIELICICNNEDINGIKTLEIYFNDRLHVVNKTEERTMIYKRKLSLVDHLKTIYFDLKLSHTLIETIQITFLSYMWMWFDGMDSRALNVMPNIENKIIKGWIYNYYFYPNEDLQFNCNIKDWINNNKIFEIDGDDILASNYTTISGLAYKTKPLLLEYNQRSVKFIYKYIHSYNYYMREEHNLELRVVPLWVEGLNADNVIVTRNDWGLQYDYSFYSNEFIDIKCNTFQKPYIDVYMKEDLNTVSNEIASINYVTFQCQLNENYVGKSINCSIKDDTTVPLKFRKVVIKLVKLLPPIATTVLPIYAPEDSNKDWIWQLIVGVILVICCTYLVFFIIGRLKKYRRKHLAKNISSISFGNSPENQYSAELRQMPEPYDQIEMSSPSKYTSNLRAAVLPSQEINDLYARPVPKIERNINEIYAQVLPKNKRQPDKIQSKQTEVEVMENNDNYGDIITVSQSEPVPQTYGRNSQDVCTDVKNIVDERNSLYEQNPNYQTYINTDIIEKPISNMPTKLCNDKESVEYVEPIYCEVST